MRRKISLYIADQLVDLDDQSFILFNYTMDDLSNPTIVKNSFSQQITLKGTPTNNKIFGGSFKTDRRIANTGGDTGVDFNASQKTPFTIYNEVGEILESGYVKLDSVSRVGVDIQYKVTLYGGLGSFFYALSYDENGNKRTLADLDYLGTQNPDTELTFVINAAAINAAWARLRGDTSASAIWDIINFAPAYNGIPEGNFSPDKALVDPNDIGLEDTIIQGESPDEVTYTTISGYCLVNLAEAQDEWAVKDLRSYLQRPIFSLKAFFDAISNPVNNGGYQVDASVITNSVRMGRYANAWMTLPLISSIGTIKQSSGDLSVSLTSLVTSGNAIGRYDIVGSVAAGTKVTANLNCKIRFNLPSGADQYLSLSRTAGSSEGETIVTKLSVMFIQAVAYASDDSVVGGSKIKVVADPSRTAPSSIAAACGYTPAYAADYEYLDVPRFNQVSGNVFEIPDELSFNVQGQDVAYYKILVSTYPGIMRRIPGSNPWTTYGGDGTTCIPEMYVDYITSFTPISAYLLQGATGNTITYTSADSLRSGATITKAMLLSSSHTPAEYMLSFCKIFGLYFTYDNATKQVMILRRNELYQDETIDLTGRVDVSKGISIQPLVFNAKWYDFILEGVGGAFMEEYENTEGIQYGIQRVNTGYDFNADSVNLMDSVVFKNAASVLAKSKYFNFIFKSQQDWTFQPSPFLDKGNTYTLWSADGETLETDISCPLNTSYLRYYNQTYPGYDAADSKKLELRTADNKPIDGSDIMVFLDGWHYYDYFKITDDVPAMDQINEGVPCWLLGMGAAGQAAPYVPSFSRYYFGGGDEMVDSLDFGIPRQLDIPGVTYPEGTTIYERGWKAYISDRYDDDTKVMTCHVNFAGIPVNQELLRKFYWYDNSLWVLNKIKNYSLTTYDPVECEFVQVQDKDNYLNGQTY